MGFNPFTAKHDPTLTTEEIMTEVNADPLNRIINETPALPTYDPQFDTLIMGTVVETDNTGAQRLSSGKTIIDTIKHVQSIEYIRSLTETVETKHADLESLRAKVTHHAESYVNLNTRTNSATAGFRKFLEALWDCGVDQATLNTLLGEHGLPTQRKTYSFSAKITLGVYGIRGTGKDEEEAWENVDSGAYEDALSNGDYDGYNIDEPYSYEEAEEVDGDDDEDPDFTKATIWDLA